MRTTKLARTGLTLLLVHPLLLAGCLITTNSDDEGSTVSDTDGETSDTVSSFTASSSVDSSGEEEGTESAEGSTTSEPMGECSESRIVDGGFEAGTPSEVWTEASEQFGTPICDVGCTMDEGAAPYAGSWYAWFGGLAEPETASVSQTVTIDGETAHLSFRFQINAGAGTGDDTFTVTIDDTTVFMVTDLDVDDYDVEYVPISIDVSDFADGAAHEVRFEAVLPGTGLSNFFLDEVALVTCVEGSSSSSSSGSETTAADSTGTSSGSSDSGSESGSSDSGSSGSESGSSSSGN